MAERLTSSSSSVGSISSSSSSYIDFRDSRRVDKSLKDARRVSMWKVLINTNQSAKGDFNLQSAIVARVGSAFDVIFGRDGNKSPFFDEYADWKEVSQPQFGPPQFRQARVAEAGSHYGKIHLHGTFKVIHYGNLRLQYETLVPLIRDMIVPPVDARTGVPRYATLGIKNPFIRITYVRTDEGDQDYLNKGSLIARVPLTSAPVTSRFDNPAPTYKRRSDLPGR